jgi:hypothetical protein
MPAMQPRCRGISISEPQKGKHGQAVPVKKPKPSAPSASSAKRTLGGLRRGARLRPRGRSSVVPEWASLLLQMVGHLHPGRRRWRHRRQGRRRPGLRLLHDAHRHSQRHRLRQPASRHRRNSRANTPATSPTSPSARPSSFTGSPSSRCPKWSTRSTPSASRPRAPAATWCAT